MRLLGEDHSAVGYLPHPCTKEKEQVESTSPNASKHWQIPDELWNKVKPFLPPGKPHPLRCHRQRVDALDAIFYRKRAGCQWKALDATGICSGSRAHRRFQEWRHPGVFAALWAQGLLDYDELKGLDWEWQAMDGAMTKATLGKEETRPHPTDRAKRWVKRNLIVEGRGLPLGLAVKGANRKDAQDGWWSVRIVG